VSERMRFVPPEERREQPLPKTADFRYVYRGYWDDGGICRVRLFAGETRPPVIVVSQLEENRNTSITNLSEYIAAELGAKHFPGRFEQPEPFVFVEHYRYPKERDPALRETWSRVRFDSYTPRLVTLGGVMRTKLGTPRWIYLPTRDVVRLIGASEMTEEDGTATNQAV
jgi:hypothetical protein